MAARVRYPIALLVFALILEITGCDGSEEMEQLPDIPLGVNIIKNPSFEEWSGFVPVGWELRHFAGDGKRENYYGKSKDEKNSGKYSYFLRGLFNTDRWMVLFQRQPVIPGYTLKFSAEIKTENIKRNKGQKDNANLYLIFYDKDGKRVNDRYYADAYTHPRLGTSDWGRSRRMIKVPEKARSVEIGLINRMTGYIYFDDIRMILEESLQWKKIETKYVTFYYLEECPFPDGAIQREAEMLEGHVKKLGLKTKSKFEYYYYPSVERFQKIMGIKNGNQRADWEDKELHTTAPFEDLEAIHMLLADYGYPPLGLTTGLVYYLRGSLKGRDIHTVAKEFLLQKKIPALYKTLEADAFRKANTSITVPAWTSFCKYLIDLYGTKKFMKFFASMDKIEKAGPFNERFKKVYDEDFDVVDRDWRLYILRYESKEGTDTLQ